MCVCPCVCVCLAEPSATFSPPGQRSTEQSKPASICSPPRHVLCAPARAFPPKLSMSRTVQDAACVLACMRPFKMSVTVGVSPSGHTCPVVHRNPSSKRSKRWRCLRRRNPPETSEAGESVLATYVSSNLETRKEHFIFPFHIPSSHMS